MPKNKFGHKQCHSDEFKLYLQCHNELCVRKQQQEQENQQKYEARCFDVKECANRPQENHIPHTRPLSHAIHRVKNNVL